MGSEQNRFPHPHPRSNKLWGSCFKAALSCFGSPKGSKRIVPSSRVGEPNGPGSQGNNAPPPPVAGPRPPQTVALPPSLLAPPSSPASFTNSALPSTAHSPSSSFLSLSANSPTRPSSTMFATGPYAHETQLVSPPVFSTFTTEPSTAPLTPPPELAHFTTPSSPDVPFARFLSSSLDLNNSTPNPTIFNPPNDLHSSYSLYPPSPPTSLTSPPFNSSAHPLSPSSSSSPFPQSHWDPSVSPHNANFSRPASDTLSAHQRDVASTVSRDSNFFCPDTFARFYLDHNPPFPHTGGRISVSKDSDVQPSSSNGYQTTNNRSPKQDPEEIEAYRASFGFSADEIITTPQYVEITDVADDSFTMNPFPPNSSSLLEESNMLSLSEGLNLPRIQTNLPSVNSPNGIQDHKSRKQHGHVSGSSTPGNPVASDGGDLFPRMAASRSMRKYHGGSSRSDAEIEYRRGRSLREGRGVFAWHD